MITLIKLVDRLSHPLRAILENAVGEAIKRRSASVETVHILYHILFGKDVEIQSFLVDQGVNIETLQSEIERLMPYGSGTEVQQPTISGSVTKMIEQSWLLASIELNHSTIFPEVFFLSTQSINSFGARDISLSALKNLSSDALRSFAVERNTSMPMHSESSLASRAAQGGGDGTALRKYTINLTAAAREGKLDSVLGRTTEIAKVVDVLLRKRQNNPVLLGHPGVGKTAVVEGLALKIASGDVPEQLKKAELMSLDMGLLQAGASVKGEFEERLKNVINEVQSSDNLIIIFIDEAHTMIGAGGTEGQNDAANLLKPALARGVFRTVAATTFAEYKKYFEKDPALSRRFQPLTIEEPSRDASINILRAVSGGLSTHHGVFIREEAIKTAVDLSIRFMPSRRLPDKAISLMDTACSRVAISQNSRPEQIETLEEKLLFVKAELKKSQLDSRTFSDGGFDSSALDTEISVRSEDLSERISMWEKQKTKVIKQLEAAHMIQENGVSASNISKAVDADFDIADSDIADSDIADSDIYVHPWVTPEVIMSVVSDWTGVPVNNMDASEAERLLSMEATLKQRVIGQDVAIEAISRSLKISRTGLTDIRKPIGVFLMYGPSGVGKTETALAISDQFFGGEDSVVTINMTEFKEAHKVSMLLGAAAGYVGYGKGGVLTEAVRRKPYCVLLLDEMEKAHREVHDVFFQIFDKGHISDSEGNDINFRNTIIIMTSNVGGEEIRDYIDRSEGEITETQITDHIRPLLLNYFSPAFLGRTELLSYRPLTPEVGGLLTEIHLKRIKKRISAQYNAHLEWDKSFVDFVVSSNSDPLSGGRALESIINKNFLPRLADECISRVIDGKPLASIVVKHDGNHVVLNMD